MLSKKKRIFFRVSIGLNVLLLLVVIWGFFQLNYVTERTLLNEVQISLLKLEDAISHQKENNWSDSSLVTVKLEELYNGISESQVIGTTSRTLSNNENKILYNLSRSLGKYQPFPIDKFERFSELSEENIKGYEELGDKLLKIGFRKQMQEDADKNISRGTSSHITFILNQVEELVEILNSDN